MFVFTAGIDGSVPRFGLSGILIFVGVAGFFFVSMLLVPLSLVAKLTAKRWSVPGIHRLKAWLAQPQCGASPVDMRSRHRWNLCVHRRMASRGRPSLGAVPGLELGHGFRLAAEARNPGFGSVCGGSRVFGSRLDRVRRIVASAGAEQNNHEDGVGTDF